MAGEAANIKVCNPLKIRSGFDRKQPPNLPLLIQFIARYKHKEHIFTKKMSFSQYSLKVFPMGVQQFVIKKKTNANVNQIQNKWIIQLT